MLSPSRIGIIGFWWEKKLYEVLNFMGWGFGRKSVRKVCCCSIMFPSLWGDGKRVRFWKDIWCGNNSLCEAFPSLFALAVSKKRGVEEVERFLSTIQGKRLNADVEDRMVWKGTKNEIFTTGCSYKGGFFCLGSFIGEGEGFVDLVFSLFGVNWVLPFTVRDTLLGWCASFKDKKHRKVIFAEPVVITSCEFLEQNASSVSPVITLLDVNNLLHWRDLGCSYPLQGVLLCTGGSVENGSKYLPALGSGLISC
ncbi:hypothetical protein CK203_070191 [Vitis vinifera]|uniref:Reverse transcriptase zinc-binding domain-containing protein n=1 Tax=Vitis vinifera TaxID=29760 RepID=A0A438EHL6_VITVI|nr:hypothetical protein CK203_070191 [Vitis vinifera]